MTTWLLMSLGIGFFSAGASPGQKPNVLLICVDDLKPLLGCHVDKLVWLRLSIFSAAVNSPTILWRQSIGLG